MDEYTHTLGIGTSRGKSYLCRRVTALAFSDYIYLLAGMHLRTDKFTPLELPLCCMVTGHHHCQVCFRTYNPWEWNFACADCFQSGSYREWAEKVGKKLNTRKKIQSYFKRMIKEVAN